VADCQGPLVLGAGAGQVTQLNVRERHQRQEQRAWCLGSRSLGPASVLNEPDCGQWSRACGLRAGSGERWQVLLQGTCRVWRAGDILRRSPLL
jgi:hypothetical protein